MERRVLIAITLSFLVLFLFQRYVMPPPPASAPANATAAGATAGQTPAAAAATPGQAASATPAASPASPAAASPEPAAALALGETTERQIVVDTTTVHAVFTNKGARLLQWTLKDYRSDDGSPLELVPRHAGDNAVKPFSLAVDDPSVSTLLNTALYKATVAGADAPAAIDATTEPVTITFEMATGGGFSATKAFTIEPTGYLITLAPAVRQGESRLNPIIEWGPGLGDDIALAKPASFLSPSYNTPAEAMAHKDGKVQRYRNTAAGAQDGPFPYAGIDDHYFASMALNDAQSPVPMHLEYSPELVPQPDLPGRNGRYVRYSVRFAEPRESIRFFFGPKQFDQLRAVNTEMVRVINYGIFSWLAVPLLGALKWVHGFVGNWGWSIVVLTILINLAMFPLRHKSVVSMRKMQDIQPKMKAIQDRYAKYKITDPERQKMNTEVMELYKANGVNPASGCVPMLLTLPFLFAFYAMLSQSIEIRGAHFFGWITNLSAPDPWFITPLLMGAAQFWQQKMTPTTMDPAQQKVMMFMPLMFTFMSLSFPSGLVIYWLISNLWGIGQQKFTNYLIGPARTPAKA